MAGTTYPPTYAVILTRYMFESIMHRQGKESDLIFVIEKVKPSSLLYLYFKSLCYNLYKYLRIRILYI